MDVPQFVHLLVDIWVFQFGAITDKIAVSIMFKTLHGHVLSFPLSTSLDWNAWSVCERTFELLLLFD